MNVTTVTGDMLKPGDVVYDHHPKEVIPLKWNLYEVNPVNLWTMFYLNRYNHTHTYLTKMVQYLFG